MLNAISKQMKQEEKKKINKKQRILSIYFAKITDKQKNKAGDLLFFGHKKFLYK